MIIKDFAAIIVTYNRKKLLLKNLLMTLNQTYLPSKIYIIDNHGVDETEKYLAESNVNLSLIEYIYLENNIGGAGGFYTGLKKAFNDGFKWFLLMDDDGAPIDNCCFENLFKAIELKNLNEKNEVFANSLVLYNNETLSFGLGKMETVDEINKSGKKNNGIIDGIANPFNGTLLSRGLIEKIGYPNKNFFIRGDEVDYEERAKNNNAYVFTVFDSKYFHPKNLNMRKKKILWYKFYASVDEPWKEYYEVRNRIYSILHNYSGEKNQRKKIRFYILKKYFCVLITKCNKKEIFKMIKIGKNDAFLGKLGQKNFSDI